MRINPAHRTSGFSIGPGPLTPGVRLLLFANIGVFLLMALVTTVPWARVFGLVPAAIAGKFHIWQLVTYLFLHGNFWHLFMNMFALWMFGVSLERTWGTDFFLQFYFVVGIGAGIVTWLAMLGSTVPTIGASGAIFGILVAFAMNFPNQPILVAFLFPVPAKIFVLIFGALEFLAARNHAADGIGHITHLAGMGIGFLYLKSSWRPAATWQRWRRGLRRRHLRVVKGTPKPPRSATDEAEINAILDKISRDGIDSLTETELRKLRERSHH